MASKRDEVLVRAYDIRKILEEEVKLLFELDLEGVKDDSEYYEGDYLEMLEIYKNLNNFIRNF